MSDCTLPIRNRTSFHRCFQQILHQAANHARQLIDRLCLGFVDVVDTLLVHLDGAQTDAGNLCELCLRQPTAFPQLFQPAFRQHRRTYFIHRLNELGDVHFVVHRVHRDDIGQLYVLKDILEAFSAEPLILRQRPACPIRGRKPFDISRLRQLFLFIGRFHDSPRKLNTGHACKDRRVAPFKLFCIPGREKD